MKNDSIQEERDPVVCVSITTSAYKTDRGFAYRRELRYLVRKSSGFNFVEEDISMIGADEVMRHIVNLHSVKDGHYKIITINHKRDWESGMIEEYDYELKQL